MFTKLAEAEAAGFTWDVITSFSGSKNPLLIHNLFEIKGEE